MVVFKRTGSRYADRPADSKAIAGFIQGVNMGVTITPSIQSYVVIVQQMYNQGEIILEQYAACLRRAKERYL